MNAKNLARNRKLLRSRSHDGLKMLRGWKFTRGALPNDEVRYLTRSGVMFVQEGEYTMIRFKAETTSHHSLVR